MHIPGVGDYNYPDTKENQWQAINNQVVFGFVAVSLSQPLVLAKYIYS